MGGAAAAKLPVTGEDGFGYTITVERNIPRSEKRPITVPRPTKIADGSRFVLQVMDSRRKYHGTAVLVEGKSFILADDGFIYTDWHPPTHHIHDRPTPNRWVASALLRHGIITQEVHDEFMAGVNERSARQTVESEEWSLRDALKTLGVQASPEQLEKINSRRRELGIEELTEFPPAKKD